MVHLKTVCQKNVDIKRELKEEKLTSCFHIMELQKYHQKCKKKKIPRNMEEIVAKPALSKINNIEEWKLFEEKLFFLFSF